MTTTSIKTPSHFAIALAQKNADKPETFTIKQSKSVAHVFIHIGEQSEYIVRVDPINGAYTCKCPFFAKEGVCKHCYRVAEEINIREREAIEEARAEEEAWADFAECRGEVEAGLPDGFDWPTCEYHGAHEAAENGYPLSWCEGCERIAI